MSTAFLKIMKAIYKHIRLRIQNQLFAFLYIQEAKNSCLQVRLPDMLYPKKLNK